MHLLRGDWAGDIIVLDVAELVRELEKEFGIMIPPHEAEQIKTVADAIRWIERHRGGEPA